MSLADLEWLVAVGFGVRLSKEQAQAVVADVAELRRRLGEVEAGRAADQAAFSDNIDKRAREYDAIEEGLGETIRRLEGQLKAAWSTRIEGSEPLILCPGCACPFPVGGAHECPDYLFGPPLRPAKSCSRCDHPEADHAIAGVPGPCAWTVCSCKAFMEVERGLSGNAERKGTK